MDFSDKIKDLAKRSRAAAKAAQTEEATKTSVILPLLQSLGFDVFSLDEVEPEFTTDVGTKKGEKVDFALKIDGRVAVLVEAKPITVSLGEAQFNQLFRYFSVTDARLAVLTNGREIWFFSDVDVPNRMDQKPFFTFDLQAYDDTQVSELERFQKENFDIDEIVAAASTLKYTSSASKYIKQQLADPDDEFVKLVGRQIHDGSLTKSVVAQIRPAIQAALDEVVRDRIQERLSISFRSDPPRAERASDATETDEPKSEIITTEEEIQAFMIVRAIAAQIVDVERVFIRDARSYCSVFIDDNNRKPVCRFYFNAKNTRSIGIFDENKTETKHTLSSLSEIYSHAESIVAAVKAWV